MTVVDTIYDTIADNWGGGGYGGVAPSISSGEAQVFKDLTTADAITVIALPHAEKADPVNDTYVNRHYTINVEITSKTSAAQLKLIVDETEYLLRNTAMTGVQLVRIDKDYFRPNQMQKFGCTMKVEVVAYMSSGAVTPASTTTGYNWLEANMIGSANAAWVAGCLVGTTGSTPLPIGMRVRNIDDTDCLWIYHLTIPYSLGTLKLYTTGVKVVITSADGNDYLDRIFYQGEKTQGTDITYFSSDNTNRTTAGDYTYTISATDLSTYDIVGISLQIVLTGAADFEVSPPLFRVYYDT
jgi:hypothetical protein